jgi:2-methylcitrate dehydratase
MNSIKSTALAQASDAARAPTNVPTFGPGYQNNANRSAGNGPMDDASRLIVTYASAFSESVITPAASEAAGYTLLDTMAALIAGFDEEPVRIGARIARSKRGDLTSTIMGYGIKTTPEEATFVNGTMLRVTDFNDVTVGGHFSDMISAILAVAEAHHATGAQVLMATALAYEIAGALTGAGAFARGWDSPFQLPAAAVATSRLMGMNEDQMANALSIALVGHMPMTCREGPMSMWKSCHAPETARCAVVSALLAKEGMTGPAQPFAYRAGLFDHIGKFTSFRLPFRPNGRMVIEETNYKRYPAEASTQSVLVMMPEIVAFAKPDEISAIVIEMAPGWLREVADPSKWDPRNRETADHSLPYVIARCLLDGEIYLDSFSEQKFMDPAARHLMSLTTARPTADSRFDNQALSLEGTVRLIVRKKSGEELIKETTVGYSRPLSRNEIVDKFKRACDYRHVSDRQRDAAIRQWLNLREITDIAIPIQNLALFGTPQPL